MSRRTPDRAIRALDVVLAALGLLLTAPVWPLVAAAIKLDSRGPVLFRGRRLGRDRTEFDILKFRSMVSSPAGTGPAITAAGDARITRVGRLLRVSKLDELPQLVNVLRGEMSIVGPRPEAPVYLPHYAGELAEILRWRPGITSPASIAFRHEEQLLGAVSDPEAHYVDVVLPEKIRIDLAYFRTRSVRSDVGVILRTVRSVLATA